MSLRVESEFPIDDFMECIRNNGEKASKFMIEVINLNTDWIYKIVKLCHNTILEMKELPATKLSALCILKDLMETCQVPCVNLIEIYILPILYEIAIQKPQEKGERRGSTFFQQVARNVKIPNIEDTGIKFMAICTEILSAGSYIKPKRTFKTQELKQKSDFTDYYEKFLKYGIVDAPLDISKLAYFSSQFKSNGRTQFLKNISNSEASIGGYTEYFVTMMIESIESDVNPLFNLGAQSISNIENDLDMRKLLRHGDPYITSPMIDELLLKMRVLQNFMAKKNCLSLLTDFVKWGDAEAFIKLCEESSLESIALRIAEVPGELGQGQGQKIYPEVKGQRDGKRKFYIEFLKSIEIISKCLQNQKLDIEEAHKIPDMYNFFWKQKKFEFPQNLLTKRIETDFRNNLQHNEERNILIINQIKEQAKKDNNSKKTKLQQVSDNFEACLQQIVLVSEKEGDADQKIKKLREMKKKCQEDLENLLEDNEDVAEDQMEYLMENGQEIIKAIEQIQAYHKQLKKKEISLDEFQAKAHNVAKNFEIIESQIHSKHSGAKSSGSQNSGKNSGHNANQQKNSIDEVKNSYKIQRPLSRKNSMTSSNKFKKGISNKNNFVLSEEPKKQKMEGNFVLTVQEPSKQQSEEEVLNQVTSSILSNKSNKKGEISDVRSYNNSNQMEENSMSSEVRSSERKPESHLKQSSNKPSHLKLSNFKPSSQIQPDIVKEESVLNSRGSFSQINPQTSGIAKSEKSGSVSIKHKVSKEGQGIKTDKYSETTPNWAHKNQSVVSNISSPKKLGSDPAQANNFETNDYHTVQNKSSSLAQQDRLIDSRKKGITLTIDQRERSENNKTHEPIRLKSSEKSREKYSLKKAQSQENKNSYFYEGEGQQEKDSKASKNGSSISQKDDPSKRSSNSKIYEKSNLEVNPKKLQPQRDQNIYGNQPSEYYSIQNNSFTNEPQMKSNNSSIMKPNYKETEDVIHEPDLKPLNDSYYRPIDIELAVKQSKNPDFKSCFQIEKQLIHSPRYVTNAFANVENNNSRMGFTQKKWINKPHEEYLLSKIKQAYLSSNDEETKQLGNRVLQLKVSNSRLRNEINRKEDQLSKYSNTDRQSDFVQFQKSKQHSNWSRSNSPINSRSTDRFGRTATEDNVSGQLVSESMFSGMLAQLDNEEKLKKGCLKNKCLIFQTEVWEVGTMFKQVSTSTLLTLYLTPACKIKNFSFSISKQPNLQVEVLSRGFEEIPEKKQVKIQLECKILKFNYRLPIITISYSKGSQRKNISFYLPLTFNKFINFNESPSPASLVPKVIRTSQFEVNKRVLRISGIGEYFPMLNLSQEDARTRVLVYSGTGKFGGENLHLKVISKEGKKVILQVATEKDSQSAKYLLYTLKKILS